MNWFWQRMRKNKSNRTEFPLRFRLLTPEERRLICNGCGPKGWPIKPPNFCFRASCDHHDFNYWLGGKEADRSKADRQFYEAMKDDAFNAALGALWLEARYRFWAWAFYIAVRIGGWMFFSYGPQKTWDDLDHDLEFSRLENPYGGIV